MKLSVRPLQTEDIDLLADYWLNSSDDHLIKMGVDLSKIPKRSDLVNNLTHQINKPIQEKQSYALIWLLNNRPIGHCNVNQIQYGAQAFMHLHLWESPKRQKGLGTQLLKQSLPYFFKDLKLKQLFCEPYALNPAPNKTLEKIGFTFVKEHVCIPGSLNFEQTVKRWRFDKTDLIPFTT